MRGPALMPISFRSSETQRKTKQKSVGCAKACAWNQARHIPIVNSLRVSKSTSSDSKVCSRASWSIEPRKAARGLPPVAALAGAGVAGLTGVGAGVAGVGDPKLGAGESKPLAGLNLCACAGEVADIK